VLTGDPVAGVEVLGGEDGRQQELQGLSDRELLTTASRELLVAISLVCHVLRSQLPHLVATKTMETATLLNALNAGLKAAVDSLEEFHYLPGQSGHAVKDSDVNRSQRAQATKWSPPPPRRPPLWTKRTFRPSDRGRR